jgi:uncharacterized delta-60 repeat protein
VHLLKKSHLRRVLDTGSLLLLCHLPLQAVTTNWTPVPDASLSVYETLDTTWTRVFRDHQDRLLATHLSSQSVARFGTQATGPVIRLLGNGEIDTTFTIDPRIAEAWMLDFDASGNPIMAVGLRSEQLVDGFPAYRVVRLLDSGAIDPSFNSPAMSHLPRFLRVQPDGRILVGSGMVHDVGEREGVLNILSPVRLMQDGSLDPGFLRPEFNATSSGLGANFEVDGVGRIYLGGQFAEVNGTAQPNAARLLPDGTLDASWQPLPTLLGDSFSNVRDVELAEDGSIYIAGALRDPETRLRYILAKLNPSSETEFLVESVGMFRTGREMRIASDGAIFMAGDSRLLKIGPDGIPDDAFDGLFSNTEAAFHLEKLPDGSHVVPVLGTLKRVSSAGDVSDFLNVGILSSQFFPEIHELGQSRFVLTGNIDAVDTLQARAAELDESLGILAIHSAEDLGGELPGSGDSVLQGLGRATVLRREANGSLAASIDVRVGTGVYTFPQEVESLTIQPDGLFVIDRDTEPVSGFRLTDGRLIAVETPTFSYSFTFDQTDPFKSINVVGEALRHQLVPQRTYTMEQDEPVITTRELRPLIEWNGHVLFGFGESLILADAADFTEVPTFNRIELSTTRHPYTNVLSTARYVGGVEAYVRNERLIHSAAVDAIQTENGAILIWGNFNAAADQPAAGLLRLNSDGTPDFAFAENLGSGPQLQNGSFGLVEDVSEDVFGWLHVVGRFTSFSGMDAPGYIVLHPDGTPLTVPTGLEVLTTGYRTWTREFNNDSRAKVIPFGESDVLLCGPYQAQGKAPAALHLLRRDSFPDPFAGSLIVTDEWARSPWYGWHTPVVDGQLFHGVHGYQFIFPAGPSAFWAYDVNIGDYLYFSRSSYPWVYYAGSPSGYLYFFEFSRMGERWFADFRSEPWQYVREDAL